MENKIIMFDPNRKKKKIDKNDLFNLFVIYKSKVNIFATINLDILEQSLAIWKKNEKFSNLLSSFEIELNDEGKEVISLRNEIKHNGSIIINNIAVVLSDSVPKRLEEKYGNYYLKYNELFFYINNDLEYGIGNWQVISEQKLKTKTKKNFTVIKKD